MSAEDKFMKGIAISVWQNSPDESSSNWTHFARRGYLSGGNAHLRKALETPNDFWNNYKEDIKLIKSLKANSFRFSFEWSRIEPKGPGEVDQAAVERYFDILDCVEEHGLQPLATLHHFTHPQWFVRMGEFEKEENIVHYVDYCKRVFSLFKGRIKLWATFNEPTCYCFVGYLMGLWAPGKMMRFTQAGQVLANMLKAHCAAYRALKQMPGGAAAAIGLVHQHIEFHPQHEQLGTHVKWACTWMTRWFATHAVLRFFKEGVFEWHSPLAVGPVVRHVDPDAHNTLDFWGLNYYSRPCMTWRLAMGSSLRGEPLSDTKLRLHPQGLYDSIRDASALGRPIYITETGVADRNDMLREQYITSHYDMVLRAIHDGYDVRGVFYWTLMDNIEWHEGFKARFGLFEWDLVQQRSKGLTLRKGSQALVDVHANWPELRADMRAYAVQQLLPTHPTPAPLLAPAPELTAQPPSPTAGAVAFIAMKHSGEEKGAEEADAPGQGSHGPLSTGLGAAAAAVATVGPHIH